MTRKELVLAYRVTGRTFSKWILPLGESFRRIRIFTPTQLEKIYELLGKPE